MKTAAASRNDQLYLCDMFYCEMWNDFLNMGCSKFRSLRLARFSRSLREKFSLALAHHICRSLPLALAFASGSSCRQATYTCVRLSHTQQYHLVAVTHWRWEGLATCYSLSGIVSYVLRVNKRKPVQCILMALFMMCVEVPACKHRRTPNVIWLTC